MADARYHSITLEPDTTSPTGTYSLKFSTTPGMSTTIGELRMGDLDALGRVLADRNYAACGDIVAVAPRRPAPGEPCPHCHGVGSGCQCDIEYT